MKIIIPIKQEHIYIYVLDTVTVIIKPKNCNRRKPKKCIHVIFGVLIYMSFTNWSKYCSSGFNTSGHTHKNLRPEHIGGGDHHFENAELTHTDEQHITLQHTSFEESSYVNHYYRR